MNNLSDRRIAATLDRLHKVISERVTNVAFYGCPRPPTCQDPAEKSPIMTLTVGNFTTHYLGPAYTCTFWRALDSEGVCLVQGEPGDPLGGPGPEFSLILPGRSYSITSFTLSQANDD